MNQNQKRFFTSIALAWLHVAGLSQAAQVVAPAPGDIFLGVRAVDGQSSGISYIVNIGNDSTFRTAGAGTVLSLANIGADLTAIFGVNWHSRSDLYWGVFGTRNQTNPVTYGSREQSPFGSSSAGFAAQNLTARSSTNTQLVSVISGYASLQATDNNPKAAAQTNASNSASYSFQTGTAGTTDFGSLSNWATIEGNFGAGAGRTALDLFRYSGNTSTGVNSVERLGAFSLTSSGALSFLAGPVPEQVQVTAETLSVAENAGTLSIGFERFGDTVATSGATATVTVTGGTAVAGTDFTLPGSLTVNFVPGQSLASLSIPILNRVGYHGSRSFSVALQSATGGFAVRSPATTEVTINELDPDPGVLAFSSATVNTTVSATTVSVGLVRTSGTAGSVAVDVSVTGGTLAAGTQFTFASPTQVNFADGVTTANAVITLNTIASGTITLQLGNPTNFSRLGAQTSATVNVAGIPGTLAFAAASQAFPESAGTVNIPITRTQGLQGTVTVQVSATPGSASASDFSLTPSPFTASLAEGQSSVNVPVAIIADALNSETNESFTLTLSNPGGGASLGARTSTTIRINEYDTQIPTVALTAPLGAARLTTSPVAVTGTFSDDKGIDRVLVRLNGGPALAASLTGSGSLLSGGFTRSITPVAGPNTVTVQAVDGTGNVSTILSRSFTLVVTSPLVVTRSGEGTLTPLLGVNLPGTVPAVEIGKVYSITARAATGKLFAGWSGAGVSVTESELATLNFTHQSGLSITASFINNPFTAEVIGDFNGLVQHPNPASRSVASEGFITVNVGGTGAFSGTLRIDGSSLPLRGALNTSGVARFGPARTATLLIPRPGGNNLALAFTVDLNPTGTKRLTGTVSRQTRTGSVLLANLSADRASFSKTTPVPMDRQGFHTFALPAQGQTNGLTAADYPQGDGIGSVTISPAGLASFKGKLADGTDFTASGFLTNVSGSSDKVPFFAQPYANNGAIAGNVVIDPTQPESDLSAPSVLWFKPVLEGQHYYPFGWPEGVVTTLIGSKYSVPPGASVVPGLPVVNPLTGNATLQFSEGGLDETLSKDVNINTTNQVVRVPVTNPTYELSFGSTKKVDVSKGDISGSFDHSNGSRPRFIGKIIQKGSEGGAYGYFLTVAPKKATGDGQSGGVSLNHKP